MARTIQYQLFLSRPSDVESHIETVKQAVHDANLVAGPLGVSFGIFDWREDATPGLAAEPQARVNEQSDGHDALLAVLGGTLGTPTATHKSGTVEEIERAIIKSQNSVFGQNSVMVFFKDVQLSMNSDLDEAKRVQDLKKDLGSRGILYRPFADDDALKEAVLRCIGVLIANHLASVEHVRAPMPTLVSRSLEEDIHPPVSDELGILDYSEIINERIEAATQSTFRMHEAMEELTERVNAATVETSEAIASGDSARKRRVINDVADALESCAEKLTVNGDQMRKDFSKALESIRAVIDIQASDIDPETASGELDVVVRMTDSLDPTMETTISQISGFHESIASLPRLTKELNHAKRTLLKATEQLATDMSALRKENHSLNAYATSRRRIEGVAREAIGFVKAGTEH